MTKYSSTSEAEALAGPTSISNAIDNKKATYLMGKPLFWFGSGAEAD
jgi:hypothetical protein